MTNTAVRHGAVRHGAVRSSRVRGHSRSGGSTTYQSLGSTQSGTWWTVTTVMRCRPSRATVSSGGANEAVRNFAKPSPRCWTSPECGSLASPGPSAHEAMAGIMPDFYGMVRRKRRRFGLPPSFMHPRLCDRRCSTRRILTAATAQTRAASRITNISGWCRRRPAGSFSMNSAARRVQISVAIAPVAASSSPSSPSPQNGNRR